MQKRGELHYICLLRELVKSSPVQGKYFSGIWKAHETFVSLAEKCVRIEYMEDNMGFCSSSLNHEQRELRSVDFGGIEKDVTGENLIWRRGEKGVQIT